MNSSHSVLEKCQNLKILSGQLEVLVFCKFNLFSKITFDAVTASASDGDDAPGSTFVRLNLSKLATFTETETNMQCLALEPDTESQEKNVLVEMKTKEFFQFLHQIENIKYCLSTVQNN